VLKNTKKIHRMSMSGSGDAHVQNKSVAVYEGVRKITAKYAPQAKVTE